MEERMKKTFLPILLGFSLLFTGCGANQNVQQETSDIEITTTTDPYGQTVDNSDSETWTITDKFPAYLKYGKKYIKFKSIEGYYEYNEDDYTYDAYIILSIDRKNLSDKDMRFLTDENEDNLDINHIYVSTKKGTESDDMIKAEFVGSRYDDTIWSKYYYFSENFRDEPKTFFVDLLSQVNDPNSEIINYCSVSDYKLKNSDLIELDSERYGELYDCLQETLESATESYNEFYNDTFGD